MASSQIDGDFFPYKISKPLIPFWAFWGMRPKRDGVTITSDEFVATFGPIKMRTPIANVKGAHITTDYRWWTAAGVRASLADDGLTFGTNRNSGVCIHFDQKVPSRLSKKGHSALTVTVADCDQLADRLGRLP